MDAQIRIEKNILHIAIPINDPLIRSKSAKTFIIASTHGNQKVEIEGHAPFAIGINAYTYLPNFRIEKRKELNVVEKKRIEEHNNEVSKRKENRE